jgi:hypothetical protein
LNKNTETGSYRVYQINANGTQGTRAIATSSAGITAGQMSIYWGNASAQGDNEPTGKGVLITSTPTKDYHATPKKYVDTGFVAKNTESGKGIRYYAVSNAGEQIIRSCTDQMNRFDAGNIVNLIGINLGDTAPTAGKGGLGTVLVPMCQKDYQAAPKRYVDLLTSSRYILSGGIISSVESGSIVYEGRALLKDGSQALIVVNGDPITFDYFVSCAGVSYVVSNGITSSYSGNISQIECNSDQVVVITSSPIKSVNPSEI